MFYILKINKMETETIVESNRALPLLIVKKPTKKITTEAYYGDSNLKQWDLQKIILDRVNREDWAIHSLLQK